MFKTAVLATIVALATGQQCEVGVNNRFTTTRALAELCDVTSSAFLEGQVEVIKLSGVCDACLEDVASADCMAIRRAEDLGATQNCHPNLPCLAKYQRAQLAAKNAERTALFAQCPTDKSGCKNSYETSSTYSGSSSDCALWASQGECTGNPQWMVPNCAKSCCPICQEQDSLEVGQCPSETQTHLCTRNVNTQSCEKWATTGGPEAKAVDPFCSTSTHGIDGASQCWMNRGWMVSNCMQSCCPHCNREENGCPATNAGCAKNAYGASEHDHNPVSEEEGQSKCYHWAQAGECSKNPKWMNRWCSKECCPLCSASAPASAPVAVAPQVYYAPIQAPIRVPIQYYGNYAQANPAPVYANAAPIVGPVAP